MKECQCIHLGIVLIDFIKDTGSREDEENITIDDCCALSWYSFLSPISPFSLPLLKRITMPNEETTSSMNRPTDNHDTKILSLSLCSLLLRP